MMEKKSFSYETKASMSFIPIRRINLSYSIMKRNEITMWIRVCPTCETNFNSKKGRRRSFVNQTKASMLFILISKTNLWHPMMKRMGSTIWIRICLNWQMNINSRNDGKKSFSFETKASILLILMRRMSLWCTIMEGKEITMCICIFVLVDKWTLTLKILERKTFLMKPKH